MTEEYLSLNAIVSLSNVLVFAVAQTAFFWYIASHEIDRVVHEKAESLWSLRREVGVRCPPLLLPLDSIVANATATTTEADSKRLEREERNRQLLLRWIAPVLAALVALDGKSVQSSRWRWSGSLRSTGGRGVACSGRSGWAWRWCCWCTFLRSLSVLPGCFCLDSPFLFVVEKYVMVGDFGLFLV